MALEVSSPDFDSFQPQWPVLSKAAVQVEGSGRRMRLYKWAKLEEKECAKYYSQSGQVSNMYVLHQAE